MFRPFPTCVSIGWMIPAGNDFPPSVETLLESWGCALYFTKEMSKLSTRGRLTYKDELGSNFGNPTSSPMLIKYQQSLLNISLRYCQLPLITSGSLACFYLAASIC